MEFDHRGGILNKVSEVTQIAWKASWSRVLEELDKCDIVCANCHRIREALRRNTKKPMYYSPIVNPLKNKPCMDCHIKYESFYV